MRQYYPWFWFCYVYLATSILTVFCQQWGDLFMKRNDLSYYDKWADSWWQGSATVAPLNRLNPLRFQFFDRYIAQWQDLAVLDVGCGGGFTCEFLASRGAQVTGLDRSAACIEAASEHARVAGLNVDYQQGSAEQLPFGDDVFDVVVCVDVLEHVEDPQVAIAEMSRVLRPGGWFCFDTVNRTWRSKLVMIWLLENTLRQIPCGVHDWQKFITTAEMANMIDRQAMKTVEVTGFDLFGKGVLGKWKSLQHYWKRGEFRVSFDAERDRIMYIGIAKKEQTEY